MRKIRRWGPGLLLVSPSILLVAVFVYGLIGWNVKVSLSDWRQAEQTSGFDTSAYRELFPDRIGETGSFVRAGASPRWLTPDTRNRTRSSPSSSKPGSRQSRRITVPMIRR